MALPTSGPLSLNDIKGEFGGPTSPSLGDYYAGGTYVPAGTSGTYGAVPSSGTISIQNFYGTQKFVPVTNTYTSGTGATETVPTGATQVVITVDGGGASGGYNSTTSGGGGGGGSRAVKTIAVVGGNTFTYSVGATVAGRTTQLNGLAGNASTVSGTVSGGSVSINAGGGQGGGGSSQAGGGGGTATGGDTNTGGDPGEDGDITAAGGNGAGGGAGGAATVTGSPPGGGGGGSGVDFGSVSSGGGARGQISFAYT